MSRKKNKCLVVEIIGRTDESVSSDFQRLKLVHPSNHRLQKPTRSVRIRILLITISEHDGLKVLWIFNWRVSVCLEVLMRKNNVCLLSVVQWGSVLCKDIVMIKFSQVFSNSPGPCLMYDVVSSDIPACSLSLCIRSSGWSAPCWSSSWGCWWFPLWGGGGWYGCPSPPVFSSSSCSRLNLLLTCPSSPACPHLPALTCPSSLGFTHWKELKCCVVVLKQKDVSGPLCFLGSNSFLSVSVFNQFIPESARYNVSAGNIQAAVETLQNIAKMNRASLPPGRLLEPAVVCPPSG